MAAAPLSRCPKLVTRHSSLNRANPLTFRHSINMIGCHVGEGVDLTTGPVDCHLARHRESPQPEVRPQVARGAVAVRGTHLVAQGASAYRHVDAGADPI